MLARSMASERAEGSDSTAADTSPEVEYVFDGFRIMLNEKIMLVPATPALPMAATARGAK